MHQQAVLKIRTEMEGNKNNSYVQVVGNFLLQHVDQNHNDAEKFMSADKTIAKSLDEMRNQASKKKVGNCAMFTPEEGFAIVLKYFGIGTAISITPTAPPAAAKQEVATPKKSKVDFNISLDDLI